MLEKLPPKTPSEANILSWDFVDIAVGAISNAILTKAILVGSDPGAASLALSAPVISGTEVAAVVSAGTNNCTYEITCSVNDAGGQLLESGSSLTVTTDSLS